MEERVTKLMEKFLWEIKGVEYLYSISKPGMSMAIVRFYVGQEMESSIVKVYNKLMSNYDKIPPGVSKPLVKPKSIDEVPILTFTLWSTRYNGYELRRVAQEVADELKKDAEVAESSVIGGQKRQVRIDLDPYRLRAYSLSPAQITDALQKANFILPSGAFPSGNTEFLVAAGSFLKSSLDAGNVVVGVFSGRPVYLREVAGIHDGPEEAADYVFMGFGPAAGQTGGGAPDGIGQEATGQYEAVTIAIAKKKGTNATHIAERTLRKNS